MSHTKITKWMPATDKDTGNRSISEMVADNPLFKDIPDEEIAILAEFAIVYRVPQGEIIIKEGDKDPLLCLIAEGSVDILKKTDGGSSKRITTITRGRALGEMSIIDNLPFSATAQAAEDSLVIIFRQSDLKEISHKQPGTSLQLLLKLAQLISSRLRNTTDMLATYLAHTADLTEALSQALENSRNKSNFFASMSHEMRTPLNAIVGYSHLLEEEIRDTSCESCIEDALRIRIASEHLLKVIGNILDLSKMEAGKIDLYLEKFPIKLFLEDVLATAAPLISKNNNTLHLDCPDDPGEMKADQTQVRQVLLNLLSNAAKFTEDGTIRFSVSLDKKNNRDWVIFTVSDTGIGMSPDQVKHLFKRYSQTDARIGARYGGSGLGLAISHSICRMVGGDLDVESELGAGSRFSVRLPRIFSE